MTDVMKDIEENIEEGLKAVEKVVTKIEESAKQIDKKTKKEIAEKVDEKIEENPDELAKKAEKISLDTEQKESKKPKQIKEKTLEEKKKELLEKVKKLAEKVDVTKTEELKEQVKIKKRADMLIPLEEYVKAGIYLGTKVVTPDMRPFMYRRRADGLAIFNTDLIDEKLKEGIEFISKFEPKDVVLVCKRQAGWKAVRMFSQLTGIRIFTRKYPAGILTNTTLPDFFENELTIVTDSWLDKNALHDTVNVRKKVLMICDTNNFAKGADKVIIGNNKSPKSLGVIFYLLARGYCKAKNIEADIPDLDWWVSEKED